MFDIGWGELLVIGIVALVVIGPKDLPKVLRALGKMTSNLRSMASEFQGQFNEAMREAEVADLKAQAEKLASDAKYTIQNPLQSITSEVQSTLDAATPPSIETAATTPAETPPAAAPASPPPLETANVDPAPIAPADPAPKQGTGA